MGKKIGGGGRRVARTGGTGQTGTASIESKITTEREFWQNTNTDWRGGADVLFDRLQRYDDKFGISGVRLRNRGNINILFKKKLTPREVQGIKRSFRAYNIRESSYQSTEDWANNNNSIASFVQMEF